MLPYDFDIPHDRILIKIRHYLVYCINLNIKIDYFLTFPYYPRDRTSSIKKGNTTILYENMLTFFNCPYTLTVIHKDIYNV